MPVGPQLDSLLAIFDRQSVEFVYSKTWADRERGLRNMNSLVISGQAGKAGKDKLWAAGSFILTILIKDKVRLHL
jgi:hypothetical protein